MRIKVCQVCGKEYDECKSPYIADGYFKWTDVACSPACATQYLAQLEHEQAEPQEAAPKKATKKTKKVASQATSNEEVEAQP